jgi:hypothetical protein
VEFVPVNIEGPESAVASGVVHVGVVAGDAGVVPIADGDKTEGADSGAEGFDHVGLLFGDVAGESEVAAGTPIVAWTGAVIIGTGKSRGDGIEVTVGEGFRVEENEGAGGVA